MPETDKPAMPQWARGLGRIGDWYFTLRLTGRLLVGAGIGALGGSGYLGAVHQVAAWAYAAEVGVRAPVEGVPYLRAGIAVGSAVFLFVGILLLTALLFTLEAGLWALQGAATEMERSEYRARPLGAMGRVWAVTWVLSATLVAIVLGLLAQALTIKVVAISVGIASGVTIVQLHAYAPNLTRGLAVSALIGSVGIGPWVLMKKNVYTTMLSAAQLGGCVPVVVSLDNDASRPRAPIGGPLLLRTNDALFLASASGVMEIPLIRVERIDYPARDRRVSAPPCQAR